MPTKTIMLYSVHVVVHPLSGALRCNSRILLEDSNLCGDPAASSKIKASDLINYSYNSLTYHNSTACR